jgi:hypothetical protein
LLLPSPSDGRRRLWSFWRFDCSLANSSTAYYGSHLPPRCFRHRRTPRCLGRLRRLLQPRLWRGRNGCTRPTSKAAARLVPGLPWPSRAGAGSAQPRGGCPQRRLQPGSPAASERWRRPVDSAVGRTKRQATEQGLSSGRFRRQRRLQPRRQDARGRCRTPRVAAVRSANRRADRQALTRPLRLGACPESRGLRSDRGPALDVELAMSSVGGRAVAMGEAGAREATRRMAMVCLDGLVSADDRFRRVDEIVGEWGFVREAARPYDSDGVGRPSIDPTVLLKLMIAGALGGIGSMRELLRVAELRSTCACFSAPGSASGCPRSRRSRRRRRSASPTARWSSGSSCVPSRCASSTA